MPKFKKADRALKALTFTPLSNNRYRCNQTGKVKTKKELLGYVMGYYHNQPREQLLSVGLAEKTVPYRGSNHRTLAGRKKYSY